MRQLRTGRCNAPVGPDLRSLGSVSAWKQPEDYKDEATRIISALTGGVLAGQAWNNLAAFTDTVGNRVSGSENLKRAVKYMLHALEEDGLEGVHGEEAGEA
jgi:hypothetical protein